MSESHVEEPTAQALAELQRAAAPLYAAVFAVGADAGATRTRVGTTVRRGTVRRAAKPTP